MSVVTTTAAARSADRRRATYDTRLLAARDDREWLNAVVGWLMAEWYRLPPSVRRSIDDPLLTLARDLNRRAGS
jgi:hypothetical protein